jgi:hypothetical protein
MMPNTIGDGPRKLDDTTASIVPGGAELLSTIITPPLEKRRDAWIESIAIALKNLEEKVDGFSFENLSQNEMFVTTVMYASQIAIRNHQQEKLEALRNAVLNTALSRTPEEDLQIMFLSFIDTLTSWHLRILKFLDNPLYAAQKKNVVYPDWDQDHTMYDIAKIAFESNLNMGSITKALLHLYPELNEKKEFYILVEKDLLDRGLIEPMGMSDAPIHPQYIFSSHTTAIGKHFLAFITSPIESKSDTDQ